MICVLDHGRVIAYGRHSELVERDGGLYQWLHQCPIVCGEKQERSMHDTDVTPPLATTLAQASALYEQFECAYGPSADGWLHASDLLQHESAALQLCLARSVAQHPNASRRVSGSFFLGEYVWYVVGAAVGSYLAARRVPTLDAKQLALCYHTYTWHEGEESGEAERIAVRFLCGRFAALPDDPAADHPDATVLPDQAALHDHLRWQIETHLAPLIAAVSNTTRLGQRAQWALAADTLASLFLYLGEAHGNAEAARAEGLGLIKAPGSPLYNAQTGYVTLEYQGVCETFRQRGGCCLYYKIEPGNNCTTCVLRPEEERNARLLAYMAEKQARALEGVH
jgi:hypothetical protein